MPDWKALLAQHGPKLALGLLAAKQGGPQSVAAFMEGLQRGEMRRYQRGMDAQQMDIQSQRNARADEAQQAQLANMETDNQRQQQAFEMQKFERALGLMQAAGSQQAESATDPVQAENAMMQTAQSAAGAYGLAPDALTGFIPNMGPAISQRKKRQAQTLYERAEKTYGQEAMATDSVTIQTGELFGDVKPSQLRALFESPAVDATGAPAKPYIGKASLPTAGSFEEYVNAPPERQAVIEGARKRYQQADDRPVVSSASKPEGLTPNARLDGTLRLRDRFVKETQAAQAVNTQLMLMKSSLEAVKRGAAAPGSQGVLVTFQKILDPTSVVRESEYARSASGLSLMSRMEGSIDKIVQGGAGVPVQELEQFVTLAEQFVRNQAQAAEATRQQIDSIAKETGLNPANITRDLGLPGSDVVSPAPTKKYEILSVK